RPRAIAQFPGTLKPPRPAIRNTKTRGALPMPPITPNEALSRCIEHREIFHDEMLELMRMLMRGEMSPQLASALLMGLRVKKETVGEITAAAQVMREFALGVDTPYPEELLDMCGTGGDGSHTFNISTAAMFVAAA